MEVIKRFDIYLTNLDPTKGSEIKKTRPCVVVSPDEMNVLKTVLLAPMTTKGIQFPTRIPIKFNNIKGQVALDQIRAVDKTRLFKKLGSLAEKESIRVISVLQEMFAL